jgi:hypothetical protein
LRARALGARLDLIHEREHDVVPGDELAEPLHALGEQSMRGELPVGGGESVADVFRNGYAGDFTCSLLLWSGCARDFTCSLLRWSR